MFRLFLIDQLKDENNHFLVMGESHTNLSSATQALDSCSHEIKSLKGSRDIIYITEDLSRLQDTLTKEDKPYTPEDIEELKELFAEERGAILELMHAGVTIYGAETDYTDPFIHFSYQDNLPLNQQVENLMKRIEDLGKEIPDFKLQMDYRMEKLLNMFEIHSDSNDYKNFLEAIKTIYALSPAREIRFNQSITEQMQELTKEKSHFLCISGVGAAHVGAVRSAKDGLVLEEGMLSRMQQFAQDTNKKVSSCYVTSETKQEKSYTPTQANPNLIYSAIEPILQVKPLDTQRFFKSPPLHSEKEKIEKKEPPKKGSDRCGIS